MLKGHTLQMGYGPKRNITGHCLQSHYICCATQQMIEQIMTNKDCYCVYRTEHKKAASISLKTAYYKVPHFPVHYSAVIMSMMASQINSLTIVYSTVYSGADQRKHQSSASLAFVRGIHRCPVNSPHKWPVTRKIFPFDDVIMWSFFNRSLTWIIVWWSMVWQYLSL